MLLSLSFAASLTGAIFAGSAALMRDTGVDGTPGAYLALLGAVTVTVLVGLLGTHPRSRGLRLLLLTLAIFVAVLTAAAGWFLMQYGIVVAAAISVLCLLAAGSLRDRTAAT